MNRRNVLKAITTSVATVGLAGCSSSEPSRAEKIDDMFKAHQWLREGEALGSEEGDEHWKITVESINSDQTIDLKIDKIVMDEVGQNKEGVDPAYTFERKKVAVGDMEVLEDDFRVAYVGVRDEEAHIGLDDVLYQDDVNEVSQTDSSN